MADRAISALPTATTLTASDLFVLSQSNQAKNTTWQTIIGYLTTALDGHGGIQSITYTPPVSPSLDGTLTITLADSTHYDVTVTNGNGVTGVVQHWAVSSSNSTAPSTWYTTLQTMTPTNKYLWNYMTLEMDDGNDIDTTPCVAGVYGDTGQAWYVWIRYAGSQPTSDADIGTTPDDWIGVYSGTESDPSNLHYTDFDWFQYKGATGATGAAATITTQNVSYQASNSGTVAPSGSWTTTIPTVPQGSFLWTRTQLAFNDGTTVTSYSVSRYGIDGTGAVSTVNGVSPDGSGNVVITASDIAMQDNQSIETNVTQLQTDVGDVASLITTASTVVPAINELKTSLSSAIIMPTRVNIPSSGQSSTWTIPALTSNHRLIAWNFSSSGENSPPCDLEWQTGYNNVENQFRVTNSGGSTSETIRPIFVLPTETTAT